MCFTEHVTNEAKTIYDPSGTPQRLGEKIAEGGEGSVWTLEGTELATTLIKLFHPHKLADGGFMASTEQKISSMSMMRDQDKSIAWPYFPVYNSMKRFVGFSMRKVEGEELSTVMHPLASQDICDGWIRGDYILIALDFTRKVRKLHQKGFVLGDINPNNVLIDLGNRSIRLIDVDSYQFSLGGRTFRCLVGMQEYTPPEYQDRDFRTFDRTAASDHFGTAVLVFQILMRGKHPFDIRGGENPAGNIKKGNFPYGTNQGKVVPIGNWIKLWSHLPKLMKDMFHKAFVNGINNPAGRPNLDDWTNVLRVYLSDARKGWHDLSLSPANFKSQEYQGKRVI